MSDQSLVKKKKKGNADGTTICIIHVVANAKDKVSGFTEQSQKVQHSVLEFIIYLICSVFWLFKLYILYVFYQNCL